MAVLQTILLLILVYYGLKLLLKWLAPKLFSYAVKKTQQRFGQEFGQYGNPPNQTDAEGETTIFKRPSQASQSSKKVGEYIDFEEID